MAGIDARAGYAPIGALNMYYEIHGDGPAAGPPARRVHDDRHDGPAPAGAGRDAAGDRRRAAGARAHGRRRPPAHLRADGRRHRGADRVTWGSTGRRRRLQHGRRHCPAAGDPPPGGRAQARGRLGLLHSDGMHAEALEMFPSITPELFAGSRSRRRTSGRRRTPDDFPRLVGKLKQLDTTAFAWPEDRSARSPRPR